MTDDEQAVTRAVNLSARDSVVPGFPLPYRNSPNHAGLRTTTKGVYIHSTRGPTRQRADESLEDWLHREHLASLDYMLKDKTSGNPRQVSPHVLVGPKQAARLVHDELKAWCQTTDNDEWLSIELAQPATQPPFVRWQLTAAAEICALWARAYMFPIERVFTNTRRGIIGHEDSEVGKAAGKSDPGHQFPWDMFIDLVGEHYTLLTAPPDKVLSQAHLVLRTFYRNHSRDLGKAVQTWSDAAGNYTLVTGRTSAHPTGEYHTARRALGYAIKSYCWCH